MLGKGKQWIAIGIVVVMVSELVVQSFRGPSAQQEKSSPLNQIYGEPVIMKEM